MKNYGDMFWKPFHNLKSLKLWYNGLETLREIIY